MALAEALADRWRSQLQKDLPNHSPETHESIVNWLLGDERDRFEDFDHRLLRVSEQAMDYRYRILRERYLDVAPERAYRQLIQRLSSLFLIRNKIRTWIALSRDRQRSVVDVLQEIVQELLQNDNYMQQQICWIAKSTRNPRLRNALMLATTEEYCLRPIRNQPLLSYRFVNYLRRSQRGGMTQVPANDFIRLVSEEVAPDDSEGSISLLDPQAIAQYQQQQATLEQQELRNTVQQRFEAYLEKNLDPMAVEWLRLYLQGRSQEAIAQTLDIPVKQVYRLREKIAYHAVRVFAVKNQPELVTGWLSGEPD
jgi:hypothetical protein